MKIVKVTIYNFGAAILLDFGVFGLALGPRPARWIQFFSKLFSHKYAFSNQIVWFGNSKLSNKQHSSFNDCVIRSVRLSCSKARL